MNSGIFSLQVVVAGFMALSLPTAFAVGKESRLEYYQREIKGRETGVYSHGGDLYLHVKLPYGKGDRSDFKRVEANKTLKDMLRSWAISYAETRQMESAPDSQGVAFAKRIVGKYYPQWNYGAWMFRGTIQSPVPDTSNGAYVGGMIVSEKEVVDQIPEGFYRKGSEEDLFKGVRLVVRASLAQTKGANAFLRECGACDLSADGERGEAFAEIDGKVSDYLASSALARKMVASMKKVETPVTMEADAEQEIPSESSRIVNTVVCTNELAGSAVETNTTERAQTVAELKKIGYSKGAQVVERTIARDEYEVVETTTQTVITVSRRVLRKVVKTTTGMAAFERAFLNGFAKGDRASPTTKIGEIAMRRISDDGAGKATGGLLKSALQENPFDKELWACYGKWLAESNDPMAAVVCFRRALSLDPRHEAAMINLGEVYQKLGYAQLAHGLAFVVRGISDDDDVIRRAEQIMLGK